MPRLQRWALPAAQTRHNDPDPGREARPFDSASLQAIGVAHRRASRWQHQLDKLRVCAVISPSREMSATIVGSVVGQFESRFLYGPRFGASAPLPH